MTKQTAKLPTSRARTAYGLLSAVRRLILAEPKRYDQGRFIWRVDAKLGTNCELHEPSFTPACGTIGCVAGWVATLKRGRRFRDDATESIARRILGLDYVKAAALFDGDALRHYEGAYQPQTLVHAEAGARHIAAFQQEHAAQLKATRVKP